MTWQVLELQVMSDVRRYVVWCYRCIGLASSAVAVEPLRDGGGGLLVAWILWESENGCLRTLLTLFEQSEDSPWSIIDQSHYKALRKKSHKWVVVLWRPCLWEVCFCLCETGARGACREGERNDEEIKVEMKEKQMWRLSSIGPTNKNKIYLRYFQIFFRYAYRDCIGSFGDMQHLELFHPLFLYCDIYSWVEL